MLQKNYNPNVNKKGSNILPGFLVVWNAVVLGEVYTGVVACDVGDVTVVIVTVDGLIVVVTGAGASVVGGFVGFGVVCVEGRTVLPSPKSKN